MDGLNSLLLYLPIASFALAVGTLVARFAERSSGARPHLITALLVFLVLSLAATGVATFVERGRIHSLADEIISVIGNRQKTYDEILFETRSSRGASVAVAIELLERHRRIGSEITTLTSKGDDASHRVRMYFVRTFTQ